MNLNQVILENFPLQAAPMDGQLPDPLRFGVSYLAAKSGLWRRVELAWLSAVTPVALNNHAVMPYGQLQADVQFKCTMPPQALWQEFANEAKRALPNEVGAAMVWNAATNGWRLALRDSLEASASHLRYAEVQLTDDEHLVVDVHSHGRDHAFFSPTDDSDDHGSFKVAVVLGGLGTGAMQIVARLMLLDQAVALQMDASGGWDLLEGVMHEASHSS